jgi:hypothetical protein
VVGLRGMTHAFTVFVLDSASADILGAEHEGEYRLHRSDGSGRLVARSASRR